MKNENERSARLDDALQRLASRPVAEVDIERSLERLRQAPRTAAIDEADLDEEQAEPKLAPILRFSLPLFAAAAAVLLAWRPWITTEEDTEDNAGGSAPIAGVLPLEQIQALDLSSALTHWKGLPADLNSDMWPDAPDMELSELLQALEGDDSELARAASLALANEPGSSVHLERASLRPDRAEHALWSLSHLGFEGRAPLERALLDAERADLALAALGRWPAEWREEALMRGVVNPALNEVRRRDLQRELLADESGTRALLAASFSSGDAELLGELDSRHGAWVQAYVAEQGQYDDLALLAIDVSGAGSFDADQAAVLVDGVLDAALDRRRRPRALSVLSGLRGAPAVLALVELELSGQLASADLEALAGSLAASDFDAWAAAARQVGDRRSLDALYELALSFPGDGSAGALLELGGSDDLSAEARAWAWLGAERALDAQGLDRLAELSCNIERKERNAAAAALVVLARRTQVDSALDRYDFSARVRERVRTKLSQAMGSTQPSELIGLARELRSALPLTLSPTSETLQ